MEDDQCAQYNTMTCKLSEMKLYYDNVLDDNIYTNTN